MTKKNIGKIVQVIGPVLDVEFDSVIVETWFESSRGHEEEVATCVCEVCSFGFKLTCVSSAICIDPTSACVFV